MTSKLKSADWERIEALYRTDSMSVREIAARHGISEGAIRKKAKQGGWQRDLAAKVRAKADALVRIETVRAEVRTETLTERQVVEVAATEQAAIRLAHREDIARGRKLAMSLLAELETQTAHPDLYATLLDLVQLAADPDDSAAAKERARKRREAFERALSLGGRVDTLKKLSETLRILIDKEREAYGIGDDEEREPESMVDAMREFLGSLHQAGSRLPIARGH